MKKLVVIVLLLAALVVGGVTLYGRYTTVSGPPAFRTAEVARGDLYVTITATGPVEAEELVDVGAQVVGKIKALGPEAQSIEGKPAGKHIDYTSHVEENAILAEIDDAVYLAQRNQAKASLERAKADVQQLVAKRDLAAADWRRAQELRNLKRSSLLPTGLTSNEPLRQIKAIADSDYDLARFTYDMAEANVKVGESAVEQAAATLELAETNLSYTVIRSPVKGTIIDRRVDIGQTVVASLNAPSLFLIARDLRRVEVWAGVNEADIGQIKVGMPVRFKVDAHPKRVFHGKVSQVRLNASMTQNVVIYTVIITAENPDLELKPYMTANIKFDVDTRRNVLYVPNAAVRWQPKPEQVVDGFDETGQPLSAAPDAKPAAARGPVDEWANRQSERGHVWVADGNLVRPIAVQLGPTDGAFTEISGEGIHEDLVVLTGQPRAEAASADGVANPLIPRMPRRGRSRPQ